MPRLYRMSWEGAPYFRWLKMHKGIRYRLHCSDIPVPDDQWTQEATWRFANQWWETKLAELLPRHKTSQEQLFQKQLAWAVRHDPKLAKQLQERGSDDEDVEMDKTQAVLEELGWVIPRGVDPVIEREILGQRQVWIDRFKHAPKVAPEEKVGVAIDEFLSLKKTNVKPKTYRELVDILAMLKGWWGEFACKEVDEEQVKGCWQKIAEQDVTNQTKKKRWGKVKEFVRYLAENNRCPLPRNLASPLLKFKVVAVKVKTWDCATVRNALGGLPERFRLYALLGLNCGMTQADIGALRHEDVAGGYLTRRRVKTGDYATVPTVSYRLWSETAALLAKHQSEHPDHYLATWEGTPLWRDNPEVDLIGRAWVNLDCPIPFGKFRSIAATLLESHEQYGRYVSHFLAHSPKSLKDKHYAAPSQDVFDKAVAFVGTELFPKSQKKISAVLTKTQ